MRARTKEEYKQELVAFINEYLAKKMPKEAAALKLVLNDERLDRLAALAREDEKRAAFVARTLFTLMDATLLDEETFETAFYFTYEREGETHDRGDEVVARTRLKKAGFDKLDKQVEGLVSRHSHPDEIAIIFTQDYIEETIHNIKILASFSYFQLTQLIKAGATLKAAGQLEANQPFLLTASSPAHFAEAISFLHEADYLVDDNMRKRLAQHANPESLAAAILFITPKKPSQKTSFLFVDLTCAFFNLPGNADILMQAKNPLALVQATAQLEKSPVITLDELKRIVSDLASLDNPLANLTTNAAEKPESLASVSYSNINI